MRFSAQTMVVWGAMAIALAACGGKSRSSSTTTVSSVTVTPTTASVSVNGKQQFTATALDSSGNVLTSQTFTWNTSASTIATVDTTGLATGLATGATQITASSGGVTSSAANLTVTPPAASVRISPLTATIKVGQSQQFSATATDASGNSITVTSFTWFNSNAAVATITSTGLVTGIAPGTVLITAGYNGVTSQTATVTVTQ